MNGGEFLQTSQAAEPLHGSFPSSKRQVRIHSAVTLSPVQFAREVMNQWSNTDVGAMDVQAFRAAATPGAVVDLGPLMLV